MKKIILIFMLFVPFLAFSQNSIRWEQIRPISAQVEKLVPVNDDILLIEDNAGNRKYVRIDSLGAAIGGAGGIVTSVYGRTGAVVATTDDYDVSEVTDAAGTDIANIFIENQTIGDASGSPSIIFNKLGGGISSILFNNSATTYNFIRTSVDETFEIGSELAENVTFFTNDLARGSVLASGVLSWLNDITTTGIGTFGDLISNRQIETRSSITNPQIKILDQLNSKQIELGTEIAGAQRHYLFGSTMADLIVGTNSLVRMTIDGSTGDVSIANDLDVTGTITSVNELGINLFGLNVDRYQRFTEGDFLGFYLHNEGAFNTFNIGRHDIAGTDKGDDIDVISFSRSSSLVSFSDGVNVTGTGTFGDVLTVESSTAADAGQFKRTTTSTTPVLRKSARMKCESLSSGVVHGRLAATRPAHRSWLNWATETASSSILATVHFITLSQWAFHLR